MPYDNIRSQKYRDIAIHYVIGCRHLLQIRQVARLSQGDRVAGWVDLAKSGRLKRGDNGETLEVYLQQSYRIR